MKQPNVKVWPDRLAETPIRADEKPFEWYRRLSETYNVSFETARTKAQRYIKGIKNKEELAVGINPIIDAEGIDFDNVKHGWLKTKFNKDGRAHSLFFKTDQEGDFLERLTESIKGYKFVEPKFGAEIISDNIGLINIYDVHLNKLSLLETTNSSSTLEGNVTIFKQAFVNLLDKCIASKTERVLFPIGNDFYNDDNPNGTTFNGTPQSNFPDWSNSFTVGLEAIRWCVDYAVSKGIKVDMIAVYCNHSPTKLWYLAKCLDLIYENNPWVSIEYQRIKFKFYEYGACMLSFFHGDTGKLSDYHNMVAALQPEMWGRTKFRSIWLGHIHHSKSYKYLNHEDRRGVEIHYLRALSGPDEWHYSNGYVGIPKSATAHIINKHKGIIGNWIESF